MRRMLTFVTVFLSLAAASQVSQGSESKAAATALPQNFVVYCRWVENGHLCTKGINCQAEGETKTFPASKQTPFVVGMTKTIDPTTKKVVQKPHTVMIDEGMKIDLVIVGRQPNGATVDVTVEQTKVTKVERKMCEDGTCLHIPTTDTHKKRVLEFVEFDHVLVVPMREQLANGKTPRVEIFIGAGETIRCNWTWHEFRKPKDKEREAVFRAITASGGRINCQSSSRWAEWRGQSLHEDLSLDTVECLGSYASFFPHWIGMADVLRALCPLINGTDYVNKLEVALLGSTAAYCIELRDSPSLLKNLELLSRLPSIASLTIKTNNADERLSQAVKKLNVRHVEISALDPNEPPDFFIIELHPGMKGSDDEKAKTVSVGARQAEAAIAAFKKMPNLKQVLIETASQEDEPLTRQALLAMKQALPHVEVHVILYTGDWPENKPSTLQTN